MKQSPTSYHVGDGADISLQSAMLSFIQLKTVTSIGGQIIEEGT